MLKITVENGTANIYTPYNAEFVAAIKKLGGAKWSRAGGDAGKSKRAASPKSRKSCSEFTGKPIRRLGGK